jgi:hypothetical protein
MMDYGNIIDLIIFHFLYNISGLFMGLTILNNKAENLKCNIIAITTDSKEGKPAILLAFDYRWTKKPLRLSPDSLKIGFSEGWRIDDFSVNIDGKDVADKFYNDLNYRGNDLVFKLDSNSNFLTGETFNGKVVLVPEDTSTIDSKFYSIANLQYIHKSMLKEL